MAIQRVLLPWFQASQMRKSTSDGSYAPKSQKKSLAGSASLSGPME